MVSIGLTGNIASGKSHIAEMFRSLGVVTQDSDKVAHHVLENEAFPEIKKIFPECIISGGVDRKKLGSIVFADDEKLKALEAILHPIVRRKNLEFLRDNIDKTALIEIPLLFETKADEIFDHVVFVDVNEKTQKERALNRPGFTPEKLQHVLARQNKIPADEKRKRADFVINNNPGDDILAQIKKILITIA